MKRVAINGFGRIGRMILRAGYKKVNIVAINDLTDTKTLAHLLKYDSVHGTCPENISYTKTHIIIGKKKIPVYAQKDPAQLPWKKHKVDIVLECTGRFLTTPLATKHLAAGANRVLLSAPAKDDKIKTIVLGVNHNTLRKSDKIISNASCTTNSLAPLVKILDQTFGIKSGFLTTTHSYTGTQRLVDAPHKDLRRARSAATNIIPTSTGAAIAVGKVLPHLNDRLDGMALRVPTSDGSFTDFVCTLKKKATQEKINAAFKRAANGPLKGILEFSELPLVSTDIINNPHSSVFDSQLTKVNGNLIKVCAWYDNEWGYSCRMIDLALKL